MNPDSRSYLRASGLLTTAQLDYEDLNDLISKAIHAKEFGATENLLAGTELAMMFLESSTRTKVSFEVALSRLGAKSVNFDAQSSSFSKGETLKDTVATIGSYGFDGLIVRSAAVGAPDLIHNWTGLPVINAGDGAHQHPTQALLDLMTLVEYFGSIENLASLRVGLVGDVVHSRVARSLIDVLLKVGATVVLIGPATLLPMVSWEEKVERSNDFDKVLSNLDVAYMLRLQQERISEGLLPSNSEYVLRYSMTKERFARLKDSAVMMHPGPVHPGMEIASHITESTQSLIRTQTTNSVFVRMAVLAEIFRKGESLVA